jgi:DtxR family transcriptional regulator, Mn-dependent transcriptional regulator
MAPELTASLEDYLEALFRIEQDRGVVRTKELAKRLGVTNASISSTMPKLDRMGLVLYERYAPIRLTPRGRRVAREILRREDALVRFFHEILGIPEDLAREEACRIEHDISPRSLRRLEAFLGFLKDRPRVLEGWFEPLPECERTACLKPSDPAQRGASVASSRDHVPGE